MVASRRSTDVVPFSVEDMMKANGGAYHKGDDWTSFVVTDGKRVADQNPVSSGENCAQAAGIAERQLIARD